MDVDALKKAISGLGISQNELARRLGVSSATVSFWVRGYREPSLKVFKRMCKELGIEPRELW